MVSFRFLQQRKKNTTERARPRTALCTPSFWLTKKFTHSLCFICSKEHAIFGMGASRHVAWTLLYFDQSVMCCTLAWPQARTILAVSLNLYRTKRLWVSHVSSEDKKLQYLRTESFVWVEQLYHWVLLQSYLRHAYGIKCNDIKMSNLDDHLEDHIRWD